MKPPRFDYYAPESQAEVLALLGEHQEHAKLLAGGQSLVPLMNFRLVRPGALVDLNQVAGLDTIGLDETTHELVLGPMVRHADVEASSLVKRTCPLLVEAIGHVGHRAIRNRGTVGGSLAHADPSAELPLVLVALGGRLKLASVRGERWVAAGDFFITYLTTPLEPDEMLLEARLPVQSERASGWGFSEISRRHGDFGMALAAAILDVDADGRVQDATLALGGGGPVPVRCPAAQTLVGSMATDEDIATVARAAVAILEPDADLHASAEFRRSLLGTVAERALLAARAEGRGGGRT